MSIIVYDQWRDQNAMRRYPFDDTSTMASTSGFLFPASAILDAHVITREAAYISYINPALRFITISGASGIIGIAAYDDSGVADILGPNGIIVGRLVLGDGMADIGLDALEFAPDALRLCSACLAPDAGVGVSTLLVDDEYASGDVTIAGSDGISTTSYFDESGRSVLRIDIYGHGRAAQADCSGAIRSIRCVTRACSKVVAGVLGELGIALTPRNFEQASACPSDPSKVLPDADGNLPSDIDGCDPDLPPAPWICGDIDVEFVSPTNGGRVVIVAPPISYGDNPIYIRAEANPPTGTLSSAAGIVSLSDAEAFSNNLTRSAIPQRGTLVIGFKGRS